MTEQEQKVVSDEAVEEEEFTPKGSMFLMIMYLAIFAAAWGLVYFNDLLARR